MPLIAARKPGILPREAQCFTVYSPLYVFLLLNLAGVGFAARTVQFPAEAVGRVYVREAGEHGLLDHEGWLTTVILEDAVAENPALAWEQLAPARGAVEIPDGMDVRLDVSEEAAINLKWLTGLAPDSIQTLSLAETDVTDDQLEYLDALTQLVELSLENTDVGDEGLRHVKRLTALKGLSLSHTFITDEGMEELTALTELRTLVLDGCDISGSGLAALRDALARLEYLCVANTNLTDETISALQGMSSLRGLDISATRASDEGLGSIKNLVGLEHLSIGGENQQGLYFEPILGDAALESLLGLDKLRSLRIAAGLTNQGLELVAGMKSLERLVLIGSKFNNNGLRFFSEHPSLKSLFLISPTESRATVPINGEGLAHLKNIGGLRELGLENTDLEDDDLVHLSQMTGLEVLSLDSAGITDAGLVHIESLTSLKSLHLPFTITDEGLARVGRLTGLRQLRLPFSSISDEGIERLRALTELRELDLYGTRITSKAIPYLKAMKNLRLLLIGYTDLEEDEIEKLRKDLPLCEIRDF